MFSGLYMRAALNIRSTVYVETRAHLLQRIHLAEDAVELGLISTDIVLHELRRCRAQDRVSLCALVPCQVEAQGGLLLSAMCRRACNPP